MCGGKGQTAQVGGGGGKRQIAQEFSCRERLVHVEIVDGQPFMVDSSYMLYIRGDALQALEL